MKTKIDESSYTTAEEIPVGECCIHNDFILQRLAFPTGPDGIRLEQEVENSAIDGLLPFTYLHSGRLLGLQRGTKVEPAIAMTSARKCTLEELREEHKAAADRSSPG